MKRTLYIRITLSSVCLAVVFFINGCSVFESIGNVISQGYENSVSYFNGYYNAKWLFDEAEEEFLADALAKRSRDTTANSVHKIPAGIKEKFTKVIDKCSNILAFHPASTLVDDALLLIGKSFYYQAEYFKAERKFSELLVQYPNSSLVPEAQIWYAQTEEKLNKMEAAILICESAITAAKTNNDEETEIQARKILGSIYLQQKQIDKAVLEFEKEIELTDDDDIKAEAQMKLGDIYFSEEEYSKAAEAYLKIGDYTSDPYLNYSSTVQAVIAYRKIKEYEKGIDLINEKIDDFRYQNYLSDLLFERANNYTEIGKLNEAIDEYVYIDTTYANTEFSYRSAHRLGAIYEKEIGDYKLSLNYYRKATSAKLPEVATESRLKSAAFVVYFNSKKILKDADSLLYVLTDTTKAVATDTLDVSLPGTDTLTAEEADEEDTSDMEQSGTTGRRARRVSLQTELTAGDSLLSVSDSTKRRSDSTIVKQTWPVLESLKNTRSLLDSAKYAVEQASSSQSDINADSLAVLVFIADSIQKEISNIIIKVTDSLNVVKAIAAQDLGDIFYTELTVPDSAMYWYEKSLDWSYESYRSPRILYILAELSRKNSGDKTPEEYYARLDNDFPESVYAREAQRLLGKVGSEKMTDTAAVHYEKAENLLDIKQYDNAVKMFRSIAESYPGSPFAAKSEYAVGWVLENNLKKPVSAKAQYEQVVKKYIGTVYAAAAANRSRVLSAYEAPKPDTIKTLQAKTVTLGIQKPAVDTTKNGIAEMEKAKIDSTKKDIIKIEKTDTSKIEATKIDSIKIDTTNIEKSDTSRAGTAKPDTIEIKMMKRDSSGIDFGPVNKKVLDPIKAEKDTVVSGKKLLN